MCSGGFSYRSNEWIFRDYSIALGRGDVLAILGPNGRGKTTLLKVLMGLLPLTAGTLQVAGECAYVPQRHRVAFAYTVLDVVLMGRARHVDLFATPSRRDVAAARRALERVSLAHYAERSFDRLSAGEQQLVMVARALASECEVLLLDEPTSSLDFKNQGTILRTVRQIAEQHEMTIAFATHLPQHATLVATHVLLMFGPEEYLFGRVADVMTDRQLSRLYGMEVRQISITHAGGEIQTVVPIFR